MSTYKLTAILGRERRTKTIHADSQMEAMFEAVGHILDKAYEEQDGPWAHGHVILEDSNGLTLHTMDASR